MCWRCRGRRAGIAVLAVNEIREAWRGEMCDTVAEWLTGTDGRSALRYSGARREKAGVAVEVQDPPSGVVGDTVADILPAGSVSFDVAVFNV